MLVVSLVIIPIPPPPHTHTHLVGSLKMNTTLEYSTRVVQEGDRRCKKSTLNDLAYLTPLRIPLRNPVTVCTLYSTQVLTILNEQKLKQEWQNSPAGTRQTGSINLVWFGEIERKLAKLSKTTFAYCSSS
jgi:hypothetical protein